MPNPISGDLHNSVEMASALMIPFKWSKIETQKVSSSQPTSTLFSFSFVFICLLLGAPDLRRVPILPGQPLNSGILPSAEFVVQNPVTREVNRMWMGQKGLLFGIHGSSLVNKGSIGYKWDHLLKISTNVLKLSRVFCLNNTSEFLLFDDDFYVSNFFKKWVKKITFLI